MKTLLFSLVVSGLTPISVQAASVEVAIVPRIALAPEISQSLVLAMEAGGLPPLASENAEATWTFASLSCIAADFEDGGSGEPFRQKECTFEDTLNVEFKISAELSAELINALVSVEIAPLGGSSEELQFYSVKDFVCESSQSDTSSAKQEEASASSFCSFVNAPALFGAN